MGQINLTLKQIVSLCTFVGIEVDQTKSVFAEDEDQLETEFTIYQDDTKAVAWLTEYPEEGGHSLYRGKP